MAADHWAEIARRWDAVGPPLRPCREDVDVYAGAVADEARRTGEPLRALLLGVTPEICRIGWPDGTRLVAVDHTPGMIAAVWPGPRGRAICAEWTALPLGTASHDLVVCDGGLHLLGHPDGQAALVRELRRVVVPRGACVFRLFVPSAVREDEEDVLADLFAAQIASVDVLKLRLAMALQADAARGVALARVWDAVHRVAPDLDALATLAGWPAGRTRALATYRDCAATYHFATLDEVRRLFCERPGGFRVETVRVPAHELGERCPVVVLRRTD